MKIYQPREELHLDRSQSQFTISGQVNFTQIPFLIIGVLNILANFAYCLKSEDS